MKIEIDIPQLTELTRKLEQLIDTLNDVAVMQVNALRKPVAEASEAQLVTVLTNDEPPAKRTRKKRETAPEPEVITYGEAEVQAAQAVAKALDQIIEEKAPTLAAVANEPEAVNPAPEQPAPTTVAEEPTPAPTQEETPAPPTLFDMDYFRANVIPAIASANKLPEAKAWIAEHGADALKDLDPKHYAAFHKFACELCGVENL